MKVAQTFGHQPSPKARFTVCFLNAHIEGNTKVGLRKGWVSHLIVETDVVLRVIRFCDLIDGFAGRRGGLSMFVKQWVSSVVCSEAESKFPASSGCNLALDKVPASDLQEVFGAQGTPYIDVPLPVTYSQCQYLLYRSPFLPPRLLTWSTADNPCTVEVSLTEPPVQANWYSIWGAAVSIVAMCVRLIKEGMSVGKCMYLLSLA